MTAFLIFAANKFKPTIIMSVIKEFKDFVMRGNVVDLAVGVIIGGAFGAIVNSLIGDVITPVLLKPAFEAAQVSKLEELKWNGALYGKFLSSVITFIITAFVLFLLIKGMNKMKKKQAEAPAPPAEPTKQEVLLTEIRDLLKKN
jgi:large conductance mechanosensitive channel